MADPVLIHTDRGLYCPAGDFHIDPWRPVDRALITHGHADHARPGHGSYLATHAALPVIRHRLGPITSEAIAFGETRRIGDATVSFHPAGHVPGSAQIRVEVGGEVWVVSGDYKTEADGLSEPFEPIRCHTFVTECTFGLPVFSWAPQAEIAGQINAWWRASAAQGRVPVLGAYALGKAQRLLSLLDPAIGPDPHPWRGRGHERRDARPGHLPARHHPGDTGDRDQGPSRRPRPRAALGPRHPVDAPFRGDLHRLSPRAGWACAGCAAAAPPTGAS